MLSFQQAFASICLRSFGSQVLGKTWSGIVKQVPKALSRTPCQPGSHDFGTLMLLKDYLVILCAFILQILLENVQVILHY
jgi:hypothetical protein